LSSAIEFMASVIPFYCW